jgi:hypothetical protein
MDDNPTLKFILDFIKTHVPAIKVPDAIIVVAPLIAQYLLSPQVLTPQLRDAIRGQLLRLLRHIGLQGQDIRGEPS